MTQRLLFLLPSVTFFITQFAAGNNIYIESEVIKIKEKMIRLQHIMFNLESKEVIVETEITGLHIDTKLRKGAAFPEFVLDNFHSY